MGRWLRRLFVLAVGLSLLLAAGITGTYFMPVSIALGPCMKDWTSPSSYRPRNSPLETIRFPIGSGAAQICYSRPAARNRSVFGGLVPFGELWRTGANEPTRLFTTVPITVAGIEIPPGRYSLYTIPGEAEWTVALNRSTFHWGLDFGEQVLAQEIGRGLVPVARTADHIEMFSIRAEPRGADGADLILEWERTRVLVPLRPRYDPATDR